MRKLIERLLVFFIGVPAFFAIIVLFPFCRQLLLNILTIIFTAVGAVEFSSMLEKKNLHISKIEAFILGSLAPLSLTLVISLNLPEWVIPLMLITGLEWVLISGAFSKSAKMDTAANRVAVCLSVIVYPGLLMFWVVKMAIWGNPGAVFLFFLLTFANDSAAWLTGNLFGKNNRGLIPASPNKSIAGFLGGFLGSVLIALGAANFFPSVFSAGVNTESVSNLFVKAAVLGLCTGIFGTLGDLCESAIKRSCGFSDSGKFVLGRGGSLDSIDSIAIAAPVYFVLFNLFF